MLFSLVLFTAPTALPGEGRLLAELLALPGPPHRLHLRKPGWSAAQYEALLQALPAPAHARLVLHAYPHLVRRYHLAGLHLTGAQRARQRRRPLLPGQSLSTGFHSLAELNRCRRRYDYVFLSPIFDSLSKAGYPGAFELAALRVQLAAQVARPGYHPPVLALGGVAADNISLLPPAGFAGAAVLGTVWQSADPVAAFRQLQAAAGQLAVPHARAASQSFHTGS